MDTNKQKAVESALERIINATPEWAEHRDLIMDTPPIEIQKRKFRMYNKLIKKIF